MYRSKFDLRTKGCVLLGYREGYERLYIKTGEIVISRNIVFYEAIFPYKEKQNTNLNVQEQINF